MPKTRLWLDGCFDGFHFAHANAIRQCLTLVESPEIYVGIHSDAEILHNKGPTLFSEAERYAQVRGCRWVQEVVEAVPYTTQLSVIENYNIDFVVHGDDPVLDADGNDCYGAVKAAGKYLECKRTEGISTTSMISRLMKPDNRAYHPALRALLNEFAAACKPPIPVYEAQSIPSQTKDLVWGYTTGSWDCFGAGHIETLRMVKDQLLATSAGAKLLVGVFDDEFVKIQTGALPLLSMLERALALAQCRYVDGVVLACNQLETKLSTLGIKYQVVYNQEDRVESEVDRITITHPPVLLTISDLHARLSERSALYEARQIKKGG